MAQTMNKRRSNAQCRYYKGVVLPLIAEYLREGGAKVTNEQADYFIKYLVGYVTPEVKHMNYIISTGLPRSTTELNTKEFCEFVEMIIARFAQAPFYKMIALPNETPPFGTRYNTNGFLEPIPDDEIKANYRYAG